MKIDEYLGQENIIIMPNIMKYSILEKAFSEKKWIGAKIFTIEELNEIYKYKYHDLTLYELYSIYRIEPSIAEVILPLLYLVQDKVYISEKLNYLVGIKNHLEKKEYLIKDITLPVYLKNKNIIFYECQFTFDIDKKLLNEIRESNTVIEIQEDIIQNKTFEIIKNNTMEEEVVNVAESIVKLLDKGIDISNIKIHIGSEEYRSTIHRIFYQFNIPHNIVKQNKLIHYDMAKYCIELIEEEEDMSVVSSILRETYNLNDPILSDIYNKINKLLNQYAACNDLKIRKKILSYHFHQTNVKKRSFQNAIEEIEISSTNIENHYVFLLGFMINEFPTVYKDDDYLNDAEKEALGYDTSIQKNHLEREKTYKSLSSIKHLSISYCLHSLSKTYSVSSYINYLKEKGIVTVKDQFYTYSSLFYNQYLLSKNLDVYTKYGQITTELEYLIEHMEPIYQTYQHKYKKVNPELLQEHINHHLTLSYSSLENFYKCPFRFYLKNILHIKEDTSETASIIFGNLVHQILCRVMKECPSNYETIIKEEMKIFFEGEKSNIRNIFYQDKYQREIIKLVEILYNQKERTTFIEAYFENSFEYEIESDIHVTLLGYIDKVLTFEDGKNIYAMIIDYKTGTIDTNFGSVIHGLNMQLLIYLYLLKKNMPTLTFGGMYWQNVLKDVLPYIEGNTYEELLEDAYRLDGYTIDQKDIIKKIDSQIEHSYIKGMKIKKDGEFYAYTKVLKESWISELLDIAEKNIKDAVKKIESATFDIHPKKIGNEKEITGCKYCPYRDICYMEMDDINWVKESKNLEFLEGDQND